MAQKLYAEQQAAQGGAGSAEQASGGKNDDAIDAEFEEVKGDGK